MNGQPMTFSDLVTDRDGDASKAAFLALARELLSEGRRPDRVFRAMLRAAYEASLEHSEIEHYQFVVWTAADTAAWKAELDRMYDEEFSKPEHAALRKLVGLDD